MNRMCVTGLAILCVIMAAGTGHADGLVVSEARLGRLAGGAQAVDFDLQWENSWRNDFPGEGQCGPGNYDAAWVFVKYRADDGPWRHATLSGKAGDHVVPAGVAVSVGQADGSATAPGAAKGVGVFIYRAANGMGRFTASDASLSWQRAADGVADGATVAVRVFALEMVRVPQGAFWAGDGLTDGAQFSDGSAPGKPFKIGSEGEIAMGPVAGSLYYGKTSQWSGDQAAGVLPAAFPKGYGAFYGMKYELTQGQYVDYLNTLTSKQVNVRWEAWWAGIIKHGLWPTRACGIKQENGVYMTSFPLKAAGFLRWPDQAAYLDWAGLRPMTELEFEKACRGPLPPVAGEFAWGDTIAVEAQGLADEGTPGERPTNFEKANLAGNRVQLMRVGCLGLGTGWRHFMGAGYYGMTELSGSQLEPAISVGSVKGREFTGRHGDGALNDGGEADVPHWPGPDAKGAGWRGGKTSDRRSAALGGAGDTDGHIMYGVRGVRTAPEPPGEAPAATAPGMSGSQGGQGAVSAERPEAAPAMLSADKALLVLPKGTPIQVSGLTAKGGATAPQPTTVTAAWDDDGMTVVFDCVDTNLVALWADTRDSDKTWKDDSVAVLLDLGHRHEEGDNLVMFKLSVAGGLQDSRGKAREIGYTVPGVTAAVELPPVALDAWRIMPPTDEQRKRAASTVAEGHWRGTIRIPWQGLEVRPAEGEVWGVNFTRIDQPGTVFMAWAPFDEQFEELRSFGHLVFAAAKAPTDAPALAALRETTAQAHARLAGEHMNERMSVTLTREQAVSLSDFRVVKTGAVASEVTKAVVAWTNDGLEIVFDCADAGIVAAQEGKDNIKMWKDDSVYIFLDTGHTHNAERCWMIQVSASGAYLDQRHGEVKNDAPGIVTKVERVDQGWRAQVSLPWRALGVEVPKPGEVWGLNLARMNQPGKLDYQNMQIATWAPLPDGDVSIFDRWGHLVFAADAGDGAKAAPPGEEGRPSLKTVHEGRWRLLGPKPLD